MFVTISSLAFSLPLHQYCGLVNTKSSYRRFIYAITLISSLNPLLVVVYKTHACVSDMIEVKIVPRSPW